jgi:hypothetical protein
MKARNLYYDFPNNAAFNSYNNEVTVPTYTLVGSQETDAAPASSPESGAGGDAFCTAILTSNVAASPVPAPKK